MDQMSFFSAEANGPAVADLAGVLCAQGQLVSFGRTAARLSVVLDEPWRATALADEFQLRGLEGAIALSDSGYPLIRTAFRADLLPLALAWHRGAVKAVPEGFRLDGPALRMWALAGGWRTNAAYQLALDHRAVNTHAVLAGALGSVGLAATLRGPRGGGPALRISGRRRLGALAELIGEPPAGAEAVWPEAARLKRAG